MTSEMQTKINKASELDTQIALIDKLIGRINQDLDLNAAFIKTATDDGEADVWKAKRSGLLQAKWILVAERDEIDRQVLDLRIQILEEAEKILSK